MDDVAEPTTREGSSEGVSLGPRSPFGFELRNHVPNTYCQELTRHTLFRVCDIVIAIRKDTHAYEPTGGSGSEITRGGEGVFSGLRLIDNSEGKRMKCSAERISAG
ncbi:hypothetical protein JAO29_19730 [Edaphobacter sp. HDX4]|uniref:hypothetical protein n=1 Tax=Edaphobacter sp. HDX4 TaxID=2794064 RepID=UPI002FE669D4